MDLHEKMKGWIDWGRRVQFLYQMAAILFSCSAVKAVETYLAEHDRIAIIWRIPLLGLIFALALIFCGVVIDLLSKRQIRAIPPSSNNVQQPSKLVVHSASYAAIDGSGTDYDVTEFMREIINGDGLVLDIQNHQFVGRDRNFVPRDPKFGVLKRLQVTYSYNGGIVDRIERPESYRLTLPEDTYLKELASALLAVQQQKPILSSLQIQILQFRSALIQFLNDVGPMPQSRINTKGEMNEQTIAMYAQFKEEVEGPWLTSFRSRYVLQFKTSAEQIYNILVLNGVIDRSLESLAHHSESPEMIQLLINKLWDIVPKIKT